MTGRRPAKDVAFCRKWAYLAGIMKFLTFSFVFALFCVALGGQSSAKKMTIEIAPEFFITFCVEDGFYPAIPDAP